MLERRVNLDGRAATADVPRITIGGLRMAALDLEATANFMIEATDPRHRIGRPLYLTSANGEVLARCSTEPETERLFRGADLINADGQPLVAASKLQSWFPLPERVATTDLFHVVARKAEAVGRTFYMFGASEEENAAAVAMSRSCIQTSRSSGTATAISVATRCARRSRRSTRSRRIISGSRSACPMSRHSSRNTRRSDQCWRHQDIRRPVQLLIGQPLRAPQWMQKIGLEWAWRTWLEPRRLFWRYLTTNPRALYLFQPQTALNR